MAKMAISGNFGNFGQVSLKPCIVRMLTTDKYAHLGRNMMGVTKLLGCEVKRWVRAGFWGK